MPVSEGQRRDIYVKLEEAHGSSVATNIMELLPRLPHEQLATREDLSANTALLRGEIAEQGVALRTEMAELRTELRGEMAELRGEMVSLRAELQGEMAQLRADLVGEFRVEVAKMYRWGAAVVAANAITIVSVVVG